MSMPDEPGPEPGLGAQIAGDVIDPVMGPVQTVLAPVVDNLAAAGNWFMNNSGLGEFILSYSRVGRQRQASADREAGG
jgi:hypothetical protein